MYRSLGASRPVPVEHFRPVVVSDSRGHGLFQDFRGGLFDDQIRQLLNELLYQIAHVKDPLKKRLSRDGRDNIVDNFINHHENIQIVIDLANLDKHGPPADKYPRSVHGPRLGNVGRVAQLSASGANATAVLSADPRTGRPRASTSGAATVGVVFQGDVLDKHGKRIGDVLEFARGAIRDWGKLFSDLRIGIE